MKKNALLMAFMLILATVLCCCAKSDAVKIYVPDGAPALAFAGVMEEKKIGNAQVEVTVSTGADVKVKCENGQADIAIVPTNAAVKICSARSDYAMFSVSVWGLLYVVGSENVSSLKQLEGKSVSSIGLGDTGEYLFKKILSENGVGSGEGVRIRYVSDGTTAINELLAGKTSFALLGEPAATNVMQKAASAGKTLYRVFDIQELWKTVTQSETSGYPQASVIVKRSLLKIEGFADALFSALENNVSFLHDNAERLNGIMQSAGSLLDVNYSAEIIARCNIEAVKACSVKNEVKLYLEQFGGNVGSLLNDGLYYEF